MSEQNKAIVRQIVEEIQNGHRLDRMDEFFEPDFVNHAEGPEPHGGQNAVERAKVMFGQLFAAFPDFSCTIRAQLAEGDQVVTHKVFRGTHQGEFMGLPPTGRQIEFAVIDILRLQDGKVAEHWAVQDRLALMQQLGLAGGAS
jgi:predicted ester cyclase